MRANFLYLVDHRWPAQSRKAMAYLNHDAGGCRKFGAPCPVGLRYCTPKLWKEAPQKDISYTSQHDVSLLSKIPRPGNAWCIDAWCVVKLVPRIAVEWDGHHSLFWSWPVLPEAVRPSKLNISSNTHCQYGEQPASLLLGSIAHMVKALPQWAIFMVSSGRGRDNCNFASIQTSSLWFSLLGGFADKNGLISHARLVLMPYLRRGMFAMKHGFWKHVRKSTRRILSWFS